MKENENTTAQAYREQAKVTIISFLVELPNLIAIAISALMSGTLIVWIDFLDSFCNLTREGIISYISIKLQSNLKYKYNYGVAKVEALSSMCCDFVMIVGVCCVFICSIYQIFNPEQPSAMLVYVLIIKIINIIFDSIVLYKQTKIRKVENNSVVQANYEACLKNLFFDVAVLITALVCYELRNNPISCYISPIVCIVISMFFIYKAIKRVSVNIFELTDRTLSEDNQFKIIKILNKHFNQYEKLISIDSHKLGNKIHIDLALDFKDDETYENIVKLSGELAKELKDEIEDCEMSIVIGERKE
ncbi:MAG: cation transporter [Erysipelotrichaceae bacterium]|nr:cation transporter [Erysipelotrichaceae bacterium]